MQTHESYGEQSRRNPDDRADRIKIAKRFGDMNTPDHKVLNEELESMMHHKYAVVVQDVATQWMQSPSVQDQISSGKDEESSKILLSRGKSVIRLHGQL